MKFPKLHLACADDGLRPQMMCVKVEREFTFASDAHICVRHQTSSIFKEEFIKQIPEAGIMIPRKAIYLICQKATVKISLTDDKKQIQLHRTDESVISFKLYSDRAYPNANSIYPDMKDCKELSKIGINTGLLLRLSQSMGCDIPIVKLHFFADNLAIIVTSNHSDYDNVTGLIMPVNIRELDE